MENCLDATRRLDYSTFLTGLIIEEATNGVASQAPCKVWWTHLFFGRVHIGIWVDVQWTRSNEKRKEMGLRRWEDILTVSVIMYLKEQCN